MIVKTSNPSMSNLFMHDNLMRREVQIHSRAEGLCESRDFGIAIAVDWTWKIWNLQDDCTINDTINRTLTPQQCAGCRLYYIFFAWSSWSNCSPSWNSFSIKFIRCGWEEKCQNHQPVAQNIYLPCFSGNFLKYSVNDDGFDNDVLSSIIHSYL